jgi:dipeptidyl aminopeptidase/acylaminoacyl peptidase
MLRMLVSKFEMPELVPHLRRAVRFIKHKAGDYGVESEYIEFEDTNHSPTIEQEKRGVSEALRWFEKHRRT